MAEKDATEDAPQDTATEDAPQDTTAAAEPEAEDWKAHSRRHEREAKKARRETEELRARLAEFEQASQSEQEKTLDRARREAAEQARTEAVSEFRQRILRSEIKAQAAGRFHDPDDAVRLLDFDADEAFDEAGEIQSGPLAQALDELLERKPHLKADPSNGRPTGDADAGRGEPASIKPDKAHNDVLLQLAGLKR